MLVHLSIRSIYYSLGRKPPSEVSMSVGNYLAGSKLSQEQLKEVRRLLAEGVKPKEIKDIMKIGLHAISNIKAGKVG